MSTCKTVTRPPPHIFEERKLKIQHKVLNNYPQQTEQGFFEFLPLRSEIRFWTWN